MARQAWPGAVGRMTGGKNAMPRSGQDTGRLEVRAPRFRVVALAIYGTAPYVQHRFGQKAQAQIHHTHTQGEAARSRKRREPRDFERDFEDAKHVAEAGWIGIPATAFRSAMISACRTAGIVMARAKLALFVEPDGFDREGTPLVRIDGDVFQHETYVRNETGVVDLRARPMFVAGWRALVRIRFDADLFTAQDVANLLWRAGEQVGIGEGRPDSRRSNGVGWGTFRLADALYEQADGGS
jgi:hypothetical protein